MLHSASIMLVFSWTFKSTDLLHLLSPLFYHDVFHLHSPNDLPGSMTSKTAHHSVVESLPHTMSTALLKQSTVRPTNISKQQH